MFFGQFFKKQVSTKIGFKENQCLIKRSLEKKNICKYPEDGAVQEARKMLIKTKKKKTPKTPKKPKKKKKTRQRFSICWWETGSCTKHQQLHRCWQIKIKIQKNPRMADNKPCRVCNFTRQKSYGVVVPSLYDLKTKGEYFKDYKSYTVKPGEFV